jgi:tetratricopeptide (TPR) repeat protein
MTAKRIVVSILIAATVLAAGCSGKTHMGKKRDEARARWSDGRAEMLYKLADGCYRRGEYNRARQHVDEILKGGTPYAPAYLVAAKLAANEGRFDDALAHAQTALIVDPKSAEACYVVGTIQQTMGRTDKALEQYAEAARLAPDDPRYVAAEAETLVALGRSDAAIASLEAAAERLPGRAELHAGLGDVYALVGRHAEAAACYRTAIRLDPAEDSLQERLAAALYRAGHYAEAEPMLTDLVRSHPEFASAGILQMRGGCLLALGRADEARAAYEQAGRLSADPAESLVPLARCDILQDRLPAALDRLEKVLALRPKDTETNALLGYVLVALGRSAEAVPHLRLALADPECVARETVVGLLERAEQSVGAAAGEMVLPSVRRTRAPAGGEVVALPQAG